LLVLRCGMECDPGFQILLNLVGYTYIYCIFCFRVCHALGIDSEDKDLARIVCAVVGGSLCLYQIVFAIGKLADVFNA
jgi:hypothetical protein